MIKIGTKKYAADQVIEVNRENSVPIQPVESRFSVQDHIKLNPLQVRIEVIIFDEEITLHGQWTCKRVNGSMECTEKTGVSEYTGTYEYLMDLRDNRELVMVDCSNYARTAPMIYPDMAITHLGQLAQRGGIFYCSVLFTQITKTDIVSIPLYIQETEEDGTKTILWSKEPFEPSSTESATEVTISENPPSCRAISPAGQKVTSKNMLEDMWNWASGIKEGLGGSLAFLVEPGEYTG